MNAKEKIKNNFSRYAADYDAHSSIQNYTGSKLASTLGARQFGTILDIGCGTGNYTRVLREKFPSSSIKALDVSTEMVKVAQCKLQNEKIEFIVADAETATFKESFDLITSNACFEWLDDLDAAIMKYSNTLESTGVILFSTFGPLTFCELSKCLDKVYKTITPISSSYFADKTKVKQILEKYFDNVSVEEQILKRTYNLLWQLLNTIKYTGTRGAGINGQGLSKSRIAQLEKVYRENFNGIVATYQIFYCHAQKGC
jgi:malonyl-CoA O-methyltransferase